MSVSFLECQVEQLPALLQFWARVYRPDYIFCRDQPLFDWQFGRAPAASAPGYRMKLALLEGEMAGCLGYIPVEVTLGGRILRGAWTANWMVDPAHRRRGLGPILMRELMGQCDVTLVVGLSAEAYNFLPRLGWTNFGDLVRYVALLDAKGAALLTENGRIEWPASSRQTAPALDGVTVRVVKQFSEGTTTLWDRLSQRLGAGTRRSAAYLHWRYADHPTFRYRSFEAQRNGRVTGVAVYRVEPVKDVPVRVGRIVELFAEESDEDALLGAVLDDARAQAVAVMDFFCSSQAVAPALARLGFVSEAHPALAQIPVLFQPIARKRTGIPFMAFLGNRPEAERVTHWYVTKSDGDQDRPN
jgi:GNAT superfamily N-acetyltransferase